MLRALVLGCKLRLLGVEGQAVCPPALKLQCQSSSMVKSKTQQLWSPFCIAATCTFVSQVLTMMCNGQLWPFYG